MARCAVGAATSNPCRDTTSYDELASARLGAGVRHVLLLNHVVYDLVPSVTEASAGAVPRTAALQGDETVDDVPGKHRETS